MLFWTFDFERKKDSRIFFWATGVPKKIKNFQKILKKHHTGELHKKGTILHQAPQITLFFDSPCMSCNLSCYMSCNLSCCMSYNFSWYMSYNLSGIPKMNMFGLVGPGTGYTTTRISYGKDQSWKLQVQFQAEVQKIKVENQKSRKKKRN